VANGEMWRTFNCGIGFVLLAAAQDCAAIEADLERAQLAHWRIGEVVSAAGDRVQIG